MVERSDDSTPAQIAKGDDVSWTWGMNAHGQRMGGPILREMMRWLWRAHPVSTDVNELVGRSFDGPKKK